MTRYRWVRRDSEDDLHASVISARRPPKRHDRHMEVSSYRRYVWFVLLVFALTSASRVAVAQNPSPPPSSQQLQIPRAANPSPRASSQQLQIPRAANPSPRASSQHLQIRRSAIRTHHFHGQAYRGQVAWDKGRWHHAKRNGRLGWWWDVGGLWYFYPEQSVEPPAYISDVKVDEAEPTEVSEPPPQQEQKPETPHYAFYYHPGDLKGIPYDTLEECTAVRIKAGNGFCVVK
jgi:hypothetical protein